MKYHVAKERLEHALQHQKTISIPLLKQIMGDLNFSFHPVKDKEVLYLKNEIKKKDRMNKRLRKQIKTLEGMK